MDKKPSSEKELLANENQAKSLINKIYKIIRRNWLAFAFALLITIMTIIVVPIIYSINTKTNKGNTTDLVWNTTGITIVDQLIVINGSNYSLGLISSLAFDSEYNLYILDQTKNRVLKYFIQQFDSIIICGHLNGSNGSDPTSFSSPNDIYIDSSNKIYIADTSNHRIQLWTPNSQEGITIFGTGKSGSQINQLNNPMSLTMDGQNSTIYIADYGNNRIILFNLTDNQSKIIIQENLNAERNTYVLNPISIKYDSTTNSIVIAQQFGYNVVRWLLDENYWTLIAGSVSSDLNGTSRTLFNQLCHVNIDDPENTYVADCYNQRIQFFQGDGSKGKTIAGVIQAKGNNPYLFNQPTAIAFDQDTNLYVADSNNFRIQLFIRI